MTTQQKMTVAHWRVPELSHEQFIKEFVDVYVPKFAKLLHEHGVSDFASFAPTKERCEDVKPYVPAWSDGFRATDYDLLLEYILPDLTILKKIKDDPRYAEIAEAGKKYITREDRIFSVGDYVPRIVNGKLQ